MNNIHVEFVTEQQHVTVELKLKAPLPLVSWLMTDSLIPALGFVSPAGLGGGSGKGESPGEKEKGREAGGHRGRCVWKGNKLLRKRGQALREAASPLLPPRGPSLNFSASWPPEQRWSYIYIYVFFPFSHLNRYVPCLFLTEDAGGVETKVAGAGQPCLVCKLYGPLEKGPLRALPKYHHPACSLIYSCFLR